MKYAIIAAGNGSRLSKEGVTKPKPLVPLCNIPLIERLIRIFANNNAESINIVINCKQPETLALLEALREKYPIRIVVKDTESSMHSLYALRELLHGGKFCVTTVDTVFNADEFSQYIEAFEKSEAECVMAVTEYIDDEKPLYIDVNESMQITAFLDSKPENPRYISGGIYGLSEKAIAILEDCIAAGQSRMRNFQRALITAGLNVQAYRFGKIIDIDHVDDLIKAEKHIAEE